MAVERRHPHCYLTEEAVHDEQLNAAELHEHCHRVEKHNVQLQVVSTPRSPFSATVAHISKRLEVFTWRTCGCEEHVKEYYKWAENLGRRSNFLPSTIQLTVDLVSRKRA